MKTAKELYALSKIKIANSLVICGQFADKIMLDIEEQMSNLNDTQMLDCAFLYECKLDLPKHYSKQIMNTVGSRLKDMEFKCNKDGQSIEILWY